MYVVLPKTLPRRPAACRAHSKEIISCAAKADAGLGKLRNAGKLPLLRSSSLLPPATSTKKFTEKQI